MKYFLFGSILYIFLLLIIRQGTRYIYELLCCLSDDINEIRKKVGLSDPTFWRTPKQRDIVIKKFIFENIRDANMHNADFRKFFGAL